MSATGALAKLRALHTAGAASLCEQTLDEASERARANPGALAKVRALIEAGSAAAVDDPEELHDAGIPRDLPGGLAAVAIHHRAELLRGARECRVLLAALNSSRATAQLAGAEQGKMRKAGYTEALVKYWPRNAAVTRVLAGAAPAARQHCCRRRSGCLRRGFAPLVYRCRHLVRHERLATSRPASGHRAGDERRCACRDESVCACCVHAAMRPFRGSNMPYASTVAVIPAAIDIYELMRV